MGLLSRDEKRNLQCALEQIRKTAYNCGVVSMLKNTEYLAPERKIRARNEMDRAEEELVRLLRDFEKRDRVCPAKKKKKIKKMVYVESIAA